MVKVLVCCSASAESIKVREVTLRLRGQYEQLHINIDPQLTDYSEHTEGNGLYHSVCKGTGYGDGVILGDGLGNGQGEKPLSID